MKQKLREDLPGGALFSSSTQDDDTEEIQKELGQTILDMTLGKGIANAEKMEDEALNKVLSDYGFNADDPGYFESIK